MKQQYLIRLDDACPTMNHQKWVRMEALLDKYAVKPMVGVIPHNEDEEQKIDQEDASFWEKVISWEKKGWTIALHGYNHCYISDGGLKGLNPLWSRSEFAGLSLDVQRQKIKDGMAVFREHGLNPRYFFAPSHTFDDNTLTALELESDIRIVSDTVATKPYLYRNFVMIPQLGGHCEEIKIPGVWTFCLHPNTMSDENFARIESFIKSHQEQFVSFNQLNLSNLKRKDFVSRILGFVYYKHRRIRGVK